MSRWLPLGIIGILLLVVLGRPWGQYPAFGKVLNPFQGLWRHSLRLSDEDRFVRLPGLQDEVSVEFDKYGVPHIQARNRSDAIRVQGYVHAAQRLFQMDMLTLSGVARISEIAGQATASRDEFFIRLGMRQAVRRTTDEAMMSNPETKAYLKAYTEGVNAYIKTLSRHDLPAEYQLLSFQPQPWEEWRTAALLKSMAFSLAGRSFDLVQTQYLKKFGRKKVEYLFPAVFPDHLEVPFITDHKPNIRKPEADLNLFMTALEMLPAIYQPFISNGSNNWALAPEKSTTGFSILANDTHLGLALPPIWYEQQITTSDMNVYGGGFPGAPGILLGFNSKAAWGVTNGSTDVMDWYEVEFRDENSLEYLWDGNWLTAEQELEPLKIKYSETKMIPVIKTNAGYVVYREGNLGLAARWTAHEAGNELLSFIRLNKAQTVDECLSALQTFKTPIQNFICADAGEVAIVHQGLIPLRRKGEGRFVGNGRFSKDQWPGFVPSSQLPITRRPKSGFVFSANQRPVPKDYPVELGWDYENSYRGQRIREELSKGQRFSPEDMVRLQSDSLDPLARAVLPHMLDGLGRDLGDSEKTELIAALEQWDYQSDVDSIAAGFFYHWWNEFIGALWADQLGEGDGSLWPRAREVENLLVQSARAGSVNQEFSEWIDDISTEEKEDLPVILKRSFTKAWDTLAQELGRDWNTWNYSKVRIVKFPHLARIPGWGAEMGSSGARHSIFAVQESHGPTWSLVVSLGPEIRAWSSVPGHNQGNPFHKDFTSPLKNWSEGKSKPVHFLDVGQNLPMESLAYVWRFKGE